MGNEMPEDIRKRVIEIIAEQALLEPADVRPEQTPEDLGIDSLGLVEAIFAIEEAFDVSVPFNANDPTESDFDISSVAAIIEAVTGLVAEQRA
jgi:acyl carrier protein